MKKKTFIHHRSIFANGDINITNKNVIDYVIIQKKNDTNSVLNEL